MSGEFWWSTRPRHRWRVQAQLAPVDGRSVQANRLQAASKPFVIGCIDGTLATSRLPSMGPCPGMVMPSQPPCSAQSRANTVFTIRLFNCSILTCGRQARRVGPGCPAGKRNAQSSALWNTNRLPNSPRVMYTLLALPRFAPTPEDFYDHSPIV